jgi:hypothetical protein
MSQPINSKGNSQKLVGNKERIALSIDLDYFNSFPITYMDTCFRRVLRSKVPILLVNDHKHLAAFFRENPEYDTLINMDFHSDLMPIEDSRPDNLHCGNWVSYAPYDNRKYIWLTPNRRDVDVNRHGCCADIRDFWTTKKASRRYWKDIRYTQQERVIKWNSVMAIGIAMSEPSYTERSVLNYFLAIWYDLLSKREMKVHEDCEGRVRWLLRVVKSQLKYCKDIGEQLNALQSPDTENARRFL